MSASKAAREAAAEELARLPDPPQRVAASLAVARSRGEPFAVAWPLAVAAALPPSDALPQSIVGRDRAAWAEALDAAEASFQRAYERAAPTAGDVAAGRLEHAWR